MADETWQVRPGIGVGPLQFGTRRDQLHAELGPYGAFRRAAYSVDPTDQYDRLGLMLTCGPDEGLYLIEMPHPSYATLHGVPLTGSARQVVEALRQVGMAPEQDTDDWVFADGAVAIAADEPDAVIDSLTLFAPGHAVGEIIVVPGGATADPVLSHDVSPGRGIGLVTLGEPRADVRRRLHEAMTRIDPPGSKEPIEDLFWEDGLVVHYDAQERVSRIFVTKADAVRYDDVNIRPNHSFDAVRKTLVAKGHPVAERELGVAIDGTGIELWLANTQTKWPLPVCAVVISPS